jgi:type IX secretion system PorP/SprF family membrane protein
LKRFVAIVLILLSSQGALLFSQDIHFSQFDGALLNISPAYTGVFEGEYRFSAIYRTQWQAVPVGYTTFNMNAEANLKPLFLKKDRLGLGLSFYSDKAGDARYGITQFYASGSYIHYPKRYSNLLLSFGLNLGLNRVGFDLTKMTFDAQYDGVQLVPGAYNGEQFTQTRTGYFDMNLGALLQYAFTETKKISFGFGLHHLTTPKISYQGNDLSQLDFKYSNLISYTSKIGYRTHFTGEALVSVQGKNLEVVPHLSLKYMLNEDYDQAISGGLCFRNKDALIMRMGYHYKLFHSGIAYDINVSKFTAATNRRGAFEIFINQTISSSKPYASRRRICPVFM